MSRRWVVVLFVGSALASSWWSKSKEDAVDAALLKRADDTCPPSGYTTSTGLDFTTYCDTNQPQWDLQPEGQTGTFTTQEASFSNCMDRCASERPLCYGCAFNFQDGTCWFKNDTFSYIASAASPSNTTHLAVANPDELQPYDHTCQYPNGTLQDENGLQFQIHCNQDIVGADYCAWNSLDCRLHATSLQDCMSQCTQSQPLCEAVAYNPDMQHGYGNCYPKYNLTQGYVRTGKLIGDGAVTHSAVARLPNITYSCTNNQVIASANGTGYTLSCNQDRPGNDITQYHSDNITNCITSCQEWSAGGTCIAVIFDTNMTNGYQNCYLKAGVGTPITDDKQGFILALQGGEVTSSTSSSSSAGPTSSGGGGSGGNKNNNGSSGLSGGAIAGIVIGAIAGLALIGALVFFLLRKRSDKKRASAVPPYTGPGAQETAEARSQSSVGYGQIDHKYVPPGQPGYHPSPTDPAWQGQHPQQTPVSALSHDQSHARYGQVAPAEMENQPRMELAATQERAELPASHPSAY